jgi:hypothetical protein
VTDKKWNVNSIFIPGRSAAEPAGRKGALCWATTRDRERAPHDSPPLRCSAGQLAVQPARILGATLSSRPRAVVIMNLRTQLMSRTPLTRK